MTRSSPTRAQVAAEVRSYLVSSVLMANDAEIDDRTPLLRGRLDSTGLAELLTFIEEEFEIELTNDDIDEDNFGTLGRIADLVTAKLDGT